MSGKTLREMVADAWDHEASVETAPGRFRSLVYYAGVGIDHLRHTYAPALERTRNAAIDAAIRLIAEECAKVADAHAKTWRLDSGSEGSNEYRLVASGQFSASTEIATRIRSLAKETGEQPVTRETDSPRNSQDK